MHSKHFIEASYSRRLGIFKEKKKTNAKPQIHIIIPLGKSYNSILPHI